MHCHKSEAGFVKLPVPVQLALLLLLSKLVKAHRFAELWSSLTPVAASSWTALADLTPPPAIMLIRPAACFTNSDNTEVPCTCKHTATMTPWVAAVVQPCATAAACHTPGPAGVALPNDLTSAAVRHPPDVSTRVMPRDMIPSSA